MYRDAADTHVHKAFVKNEGMVFYRVSVVHCNYICIHINIMYLFAIKVINYNFLCNVNSLYTTASYKCTYMIKVCCPSTTFIMASP